MRKIKSNESNSFRNISFVALLSLWGLACEPAREGFFADSGKDPGPNKRSEAKQEATKGVGHELSASNTPDANKKVHRRKDPANSVKSAIDVVNQEAHGLGLNPLENGEWSYQNPSKPWKAVIGLDGQVRFESARAQVPIHDALRFSGPEDWIRRGGPDSKSAKDRLQWLKSTHDFRVRLREKWMDSLWSTESKKLEAALLKIWKDSTQGPIERRKRIFELWDEYAELRSAKGDSTEFADRIELFGDRSRTKIYGFIRKHLAKGSENAYSESELSQLNRNRKSRAKFNPY